MTATKVTFLNAREVAYLRGIAGEALETQDKTAALLSNAEAEKESDTRRRLALGNKVNRQRADRLKAVGMAETHVKDFCRAFARVLASADAERRTLAELDTPAPGLTPASILRRFGRYLSAALGGIDGVPKAWFGEMRLTNLFRPLDTWVEAEKHVTSALSGREGNGAVDEQPDNTGDDK